MMNENERFLIGVVAIAIVAALIIGLIQPITRDASWVFIALLGLVAIAFSDGITEHLYKLADTQRNPTGAKLISLASVPFAKASVHILGIVPERRS